MGTNSVIVHHDTQAGQCMIGVVYGCKNIFHLSEPRDDLPLTEYPAIARMNIDAMFDVDTEGKAWSRPTDWTIIGQEGYTLHDEINEEAEVRSMWEQWKSLVYGAWEDEQRTAEAEASDHQSIDPISHTTHDEPVDQGDREIHKLKEEK